MWSVGTGTLPVDAVRTWSQYAEYVEDLVHLTHEGYRFLLIEPKQLELLGADEAHLGSAKWKAERAQREVDAGFTMLHAHSLIGLWGAMECLVEDLFLHRLVSDPALLATEGLAKIKIPAASVAGGTIAMAEAVLLEVSRANSTDLRSAPARFERLLNCVSLGGRVPPRVAHALHRAQAARNVWAHRAGVADQRFVDACPDWGFEVGDQVELSFAEFGPLMHGLHMYALILLNRYRLLLGCSPLWSECAGYEGVLDDFKSTNAAADPPPESDPSAAPGD